MRMEIGGRAGRWIACAAMLGVAACASGGTAGPSGGPVATSAGSGLGGVGGAVTPATTTGDVGAANTGLGAGTAGH